MNVDREAKQGFRAQAANPVLTEMVEAGSPRWSRFWLRVRQLGFLGFLFFLIKGLLWLIVPAVVIWWRSRNG